MLDTDARYDLDHNVYLNTIYKGEIKLTPEEAIDVAYSIIDSYGLKYEMLDELDNAYFQDKEGKIYGNF